jgi:hypothetical protein
MGSPEDTGPATKALVSSQPGKNLIAYREWMTPNEFTLLAGFIAVDRDENIPVPSDFIRFLCPNLIGFGLT